MMAVRKNMLREIEVEGERRFECEVCGLTYREKEWAQKCQEWCSTHNSCNVEVIMHAVESEKAK